MLFSLLKKEVGALGFALVNRTTTRKRKPSKVRGAGAKLLIGLLGVYVLGIFGFLFFMLSDSMCKPFVDAGLGLSTGNNLNTISWPVLFNCFKRSSRLFEP